MLYVPRFPHELGKVLSLDICTNTETARLARKPHTRLETAPFLRNWSRVRHRGASKRPSESS